MLPPASEYWLKCSRAPKIANSWTICGSGHAIRVAMAGPNEMATPGPTVTNEDTWLQPAVPARAPSSRSLITPGTSDAELAAVERATPLGRWGGEQEIAKAVLALIGSDFITGETIRVDGGRHVR